MKWQTDRIIPNARLDVKQLIMSMEHSAIRIPGYDGLRLDTASEDRAGKPELKYRDDYDSVHVVADKRYLTLDSERRAARRTPSRWRRGPPARGRRASRIRCSGQNSPSERSSENSL